MNKPPVEFWSLPAEDLLKILGSSKEGLSGAEAEKRIALLGENQLRPAKRSNALSLLVSQFKSPIILLLIFATILSFFLHDPVDAFIILLIILISGLLGFWQEYSASNAVEKLLSIVQTKAAVLRDGTSTEIPIEKIVPGDIVSLNAGDIIPGDSLVLESNDLFVDEAILTGETFPVEKTPLVLSANTELSQRTNSLWMGTHVINGMASVLIVRTGKETELGKVSERLKLRPLETEFELGIRQFGYFLMEVTLILVVSIFAINVYLARPVLDSFLFSLALAVGLTPQLLPAIISINLSHGAKRMAEKKVIVKRLSSIENFGSMNVICSDKTGTLTEGIVHLQSALDIDGSASNKVLLKAYINAFYETGFQNPIDEAIRSYGRHDLSGYKKLKEIPYDFIRKRLSILVSHDNTYLMVTKGALQNILAVCTKVETRDGTISNISGMLGQIQMKFEELSSDGFRTLGVAYRNIAEDSQFGKEQESEMIFSGFLVLPDPRCRLQ